MWCAVDNHNYMCHTCANEILDSNFNKILKLHEIAPNFTYLQKSYFLKYNWNWNCSDQLLLPINFMAGICKESTFFIFASCEP